MDKMLFISANGAKNVALQQSVTNNNLANVNTTGFREAYVAFRALPVVGGGGYPTRAYVIDTSVGHSTKQGVISYTGNDRDFAILGKGYFAVKDRHGLEAYTRAGGFEIDQNGVMRTRTGYAILDQAGQEIIVPLQVKVTISPTGLVQTQVPGEEVNDLAQIKLVADPTGKDFFRGEGDIAKKLLKDRGSADNPAIDETERRPFPKSLAPSYSQRFDTNDSGEQISSYTSIDSDGKNPLLVETDQSGNVIQRWQSVNEDGLFRRRDGQIAQPALPGDGVEVLAGAIEGSNVSAVGALVQMIEQSRMFDLNIKMMQRADEIEQSSNQIARI